MKHYAYKELMDYPKGIFCMEPMANDYQSDIYFSPAMKSFLTGNKMFIGENTCMTDGFESDELIGFYKDTGKFMAELIDRYSQKDFGTNNDQHYSKGPVGVYPFPDGKNKNEMIILGPMAHTSNPQRVVLGVLLQKEAERLSKEKINENKQ